MIWAPPPPQDMSGFAGGLSKMFMTFISTGSSMVPPKAGIHTSMRATNHHGARV